MAIYTSPLIRELQTERPLKDFHPSAPILEEKGFIEMDLGEFDGMKVQFKGMLRGTTKDEIVDIN